MRRFVSLVSALVALVLVSAVSVPAYAAEDEYKSLPIAKANPNASREVIESLPEVVQQSTVKIGSGYQPGQPIYYPDGQLVEGQVVRTVAAGPCTRIIISALAGGAWSGVSTCQGSIFGRPGLFVTYDWSRADTSEGSACLQVRGTKNETRPIRAWHNAGCGSSGGASVYWGNRLDQPAARAKSQSVVAGFSGFWSRI